MKKCFWIRYVVKKSSSVLSLLNSISPDEHQALVGQHSTAFRRRELDSLLRHGVPWLRHLCRCPICLHGVLLTNRSRCDQKEDHQSKIDIRHKDSKKHHHDRKRRSLRIACHCLDAFIPPHLNHAEDLLPCDLLGRPYLLGYSPRLISYVHHWRQPDFQGECRQWSLGVAAAES